MEILLVSMGRSWAIVPEAYLFPDVPFGAVHVLTSDSPSVDNCVACVIQWFADYAPHVSLSITRIQGFGDLSTESEHFLFEEALYRWLLHKNPNGTAYVCLSGGYKTMSAAVQKGAGIFGSRDVFHVLCKSNPSTGEAIAEAQKAGEILWIRLGPEGGWPQVRSLSASDFPIPGVCDGCVMRIEEPVDYRLRLHIHAISCRMIRIGESWEKLPSLPFPSLATWSAAGLEWLEQPLDPTTDATWIHSLPKVELHCHLGGFATQGADLEAVRAAAPAPEAGFPPVPVPPEGWPWPQSVLVLDAYMALGDANGSKLLFDPGSLQRQVELLYAHLQEQHIVYAEIRCSPNNYTGKGAASRSAWDVLTHIRATFQACMDRAAASPGECACHVNLLVIATRLNGGDRSSIARHLSLAVTAAQHWQTGCKVVGVDLAGFEHRETRAALFQTDFELAHRVGLAVTCHAGENDDAEGIWQAVFKLNARRIGHALRLEQSQDLLRAVAERGVGVEMCPFANYQIAGFAPMPGRPPYPLRKYLEMGIPVSVNTDNIGISAASLSDNILALAKLCPGITRLEVLQLQANAVRTAFATAPERDELFRLIDRNLSLP